MPATIRTLNRPTNPPSTHPPNNTNSNTQKNSFGPGSPEWTPQLRALLEGPTCKSTKGGSVLLWCYVTLFCVDEFVGRVGRSNSFHVPCSPP